MVYVKNVWVDDDGTGTLGTRITKARLDNMEQGIADAGTSIPLVTVLPNAPNDGDQCYYLADTTPSYGGPYLWHLRYRAAAASTSKWEIVASPTEMRSFLSPQVTTTNPAPQDLGGPYLTVPVAGDYDIQYGTVVQHDKGTDAGAIVRLVKNAGNVFIEDGISPISPVGSATYGWTGPLSARTRATLAAGDQLKLLYRSASGVACGWSVRDLRVKPIRVGP